MQPMRLAYFTNHYPKVSHSFIRREVLALEKLGFQVDRIALRSDDKELVDELDKAELKKTGYILNQSLHHIGFYVVKAFFQNPLGFFHTLLCAIRLGWRSDRGLLRHIIYFVESCVLCGWQREREIEHTHAHFGTNSATVVMFAKLLGGADYSFTVHGPEEFDKPEFIHLAEKIRRSKFTVAISSFGKSQLFRLVDSSQWAKIKVIHCGLSDDFLTEKHEPIPVQSQRIVCVGRLCEQKGQLLLLDAVSLLRLSGVEVELVLAGDGPMRTEIEIRISELNIADAVQITGWVTSDQVKQLLLSSQAMVLPSFAEGLPVVIMESLALKVPVISTYIAGIPELIHSGDNGWLIPAGDVDALADAIRKVLQLDEAARQEICQKGYDAVMQQHNIDTEVAKLADLFEGKGY